MNKTLKRVLTLALALMMLLSLSVAAFAEGEEIQPTTGTMTVYLHFNSNQTRRDTYCWFSLASADKSFTVKRSSVKVTAGTAEAKLYAFEKSFYGYDTQYDYSGDKTWDDESSYRSYDYEIGVKIYKPGTFTVKYKIGTTSYSLKVKVLQYVNPIKTITLTGVNGGSSFAARTKYQYSNFAEHLSLPAKKTNTSLKITAKDGWKITNIQFRDTTKNTTRSYSCSGSPVSSFTLKCGTLYATRAYQISVTLCNTKNGASQSVYYYISGAKI